MTITQEELQLLEYHGFSIINEDGSALVWDDQTQEAYGMHQALAMAKARESISGLVTIGVRTGTLAYQVALECFTDEDFCGVADDPKGSKFKMQVIKIKKDDYQSFIDVYMTVSNRNQS